LTELVTQEQRRYQENYHSEKDGHSDAIGVLDLIVRDLAEKQSRQASLGLVSHER
jgi:hypothetical protein